MRRLAFHFLEAPFPHMRSNSVGVTSRPLGSTMAMRRTSKAARLLLHTTGTREGSSGCSWGSGGASAT